MKRLFSTRAIVLMCSLFLASLVLDSCAASKPGFNSSGKKGKKVKSSGKMYR